jgi:hypothetical protein
VSNFQAPGDFSLSESVGKRLLTPGGAVAPGVAPELMPVIVLENDRPENMFLSYQRMFGRSTNLGAGGAGTRASVRVCNLRPDMLITIEMATAASDYQVTVERGALGAIPFGTSVPGLPRDTRIAPPGSALGTSSTAVVIQDNTLAALVTLLHRGTANIQWTTPVVIGPGDHFVLQAAADASALTNWSIHWRERRLNPSERI